jgi:hypothetical protein
VSVHDRSTAGTARPAQLSHDAVILNIKWRCSLNAMWRSPRWFCPHDVLIRFPVR